MEALVSFVLSIVAGVIIDYICKWLDRRQTAKSDQHSNKKDRG